MIPRLGKAAKEYNVATSTIVDFLFKKGFVIENNDNTKLSAELYALIDQEYQIEKDVKAESQKLEIGSGFKSHTTSDNKEETPTVSEIEKKEIIINQPTQIEKHEKEISQEIPAEEKVAARIEVPKQKLKIVGKIDLESHAKKKTKKKDKPVTNDDSINSSEDIEIKLPSVEQLEVEKVSEPIKLDEDIDKMDVVKGKELDSEPIIEAEQEQVQTDKQEVEQEIEQKEDSLPEVIDISPETNDEIISEESDSKTPNPKPNVIGKIDLDNINMLTKPKKKTREELQLEKKEKKEKELENKRLQQEKFKQKKNDFVKNTKKDDSAPNFVEDKLKEDPADIEKKETKKIWKKNIGGVESEDDKAKKKRKRIKTSFSKYPEPEDSTLGFKKRKDRGAIPPKPGHKIDYSEEEIEKQVKKTMARLAPIGKTKSSKYRREKREHIQHEIIEAQERSELEKNILKVTEFITANELATMMNMPVTQIISTCMSIGMAVAINQRLGAETISLLADEFGYKVQFVGLDDEEKEDEIDMNPEFLVERSPIVTVMGHVDHGKTSLLDYIRKTNVIAGEEGGITQHIGAYEVQLPNKKRITFLDTPGHEAFTAMRARGAKVTDIVIVVIAADDSIMPQTAEAINHAQAAGVPMIFAINKIDKPGAEPEKIRASLANMNLLVEEWGGKIQSQDISAKKGLNVEVLLEKILIEAEMLDLKANPKAIATGTVIESSLDKGRGYIAKILVQNGTLQTGEVIAAGSACGKVRAMYNERNQLIKEAGPSSPVLILGLNSAPQAGDTFKVYKEEREAKAVVNKRIQLVREQGLRTQKHITLDEIGRRIAIGDFKELNIIVKGDVDGSIEALTDALLRLSTDEVQLNVIHKSVGQVIESDVLLASASNAIIIAFQVRPSGGAKKLAEQEQVDIRTYSIIYDAINELKDAIEGMRAPEIKENIVCNIEVRETFHISKIGTIAGCFVLDGKVQRNTQIRVIRDGIVIFTGKLGSLKRFKDDVKEVSANYECGLNIVGFNDIKVGDIIEGFEQIEVKR
ncbi:MAG: translation initiation factor IF-2 [Bacteroidales bacterium]|nr:translation initiation factor IF-2 [Bacteroidales bacterium]